MSEITRQRVRYTAKRTGMDSMFIQGHGIISKGQQLELDSDTAERWAEPLPAANGEFLSDWTIVGDPISRTKEEAVEIDQKQYEKLIETSHPVVVVDDTQTPVKQEAPVDISDADKPQKESSQKS